MNPAPCKYSVYYAVLFESQVDNVIKIDFEKIELKEGAG